MISALLVILEILYAVNCYQYFTVISLRLSSSMEFGFTLCLDFTLVFIAFIGKGFNTRCIQIKVSYGFYNKYVSVNLF